MAAPVMRRGEAFDGPFALTVVGGRLEVGDPAPEFSLDCLDATGLHPMTLADTAGQVRIVNVLNSIDTPACDVQTRRCDALAAGVPGVVVLTVSMDLPFALGRWTAANGASHTVGSAHRSEAFGVAYGVLLAEWRALQRSVFVVDGDGVLRHVEYVADQAAQPDLEAAVRTAQTAAAG